MYKLLKVLKNKKRCLDHAVRVFRLNSFNMYIYKVVYKTKLN